MRRNIVAVVLLSLISCLACQPSQPVVDIETEKTAIRNVLSAYVRAVEAEDLAMYSQNVAHDESMTNFGAFGPPIIGWDALREVIAGQNEALSEINITEHDVSITLCDGGDQAWATSRWDFGAMMGEQPRDLNVRCTWVLKKAAGAWTIVHFHKSVSAG
jgi:ketosteroid isomerase-like protein